MEPDKAMLLAVTAPLFVTLNSDAEINNSLSTVEAEIANKLAELNLLVSSKNPPIEPLLACIEVALRSPLNLALDAVI